MNFKMIGLWIFLVVFFVAAYQLLGHEGVPSSQVDAASAAPAGGFFSTSWSWLPVLVFFAVVAFFLVRSRKTNNLSTGGIGLLSQGRYLEAVRAFEEAQKRAPKSAVATHNLGVAQLGLWRVAEADASFAKAAKMSMRLMDLRGLLAPYRAITAALLGRQADAQARLAECDALNVGSASDATLARAVLAVRAGQWSDAEKLLGRTEIRMLGGPLRGLAEALHAWAIEQRTGERRFVDHLGIFFEAGPDSLKPFWPELHDFLQRGEQGGAQVSVVP